MVGNLAADYLRRREVLELDLALQRGVILHRHIDHGTDTHPHVRRAWRLLRPHHGKYASVVYDILADYLLTRDWATFERAPLAEVAEGAYAAVREHAGGLPSSLAARLARMASSDWLTQYGTYEGLDYVFTRFGRRLSKPELLDGVIDSLRLHEEVLTAGFRSFYPWLQASCARKRRELRHTRKDSEDELDHPGGSTPRSGS